ncbi:LysR family transcriptional regulator, partial [Pseudomonas sp. B6002]|uniref:LysR substrate-binding domain-containing protein n=1 Tax=Pseudomonas sp. B6002 TaxID=2726978 RepID=UPI0017A6A6E4
AIAVDVQGALMLDNPTLMLQAARAGMGLTYLTEWNAAMDLAEGTLVRVLEEWTPSYDKLRLYYPGRRHVPAGLRALIELIKDKGF